MKSKLFTLAIHMIMMGSYSNDNYGFNYYRFEEQPYFRFSKNYYFIKNEHLNLGIAFIPYELGAYRLQFERFEPGNEQVSSEKYLFHSAGVGPIFEYICYDRLFLKIEYNALLNVDGPYRPFYHKLESRVTYCFWMQFQVGFSVNLAFIHNNLKEESYAPGQRRIDFVLA